MTVPKIYHLEDGFSGSLRQVAEHAGIKCETLRLRLKHGIPLEEAISKPVQKKGGNAPIYTLPDGFSGTLQQVAEHAGINYGTLKSRLKNGLPLEEAISQPVKPTQGKIYTLSDGFVGNIVQIAKHVGVNYYTLQDRLNGGLPLEKAITKPMRKSGYVTIYTLADGFQGNFKQVAEHASMNYTLLQNRLRHGYTLEEAMQVPLEWVQTKNLPWKGERMTLQQICQLEGVEYALVYNHLLHLHTLVWAVTQAKSLTGKG